MHKTHLLPAYQHADDRSYFHKERSLRVKIMQNNQNLWAGLLIGSVLTGLLMYVFYQQTSPPETTSSTTIDPAPLATPFIEQKSPETAKTTEPAIESPPTTQVEPTKAKVIEKTVPAPQTIPEDKAVQTQVSEKIQDIDLPGIPKNPRLPDEALAKLSPEERQRYEKVLATYHKVRDKVVNLHRERALLERQMEKIIEENTLIDQQLDEVRQHQNSN